MEGGRGEGGEREGGREGEREGERAHNVRIPSSPARLMPACLMRQARDMLAPSRRVASLVYGASLVSTLLSTLVLRRDTREIEEGCSPLADDW